MQLQTTGAKALIKEKAVGVRVAAVAGLVLLLAVVAPILAAAVSAGLSLIALAIIGIVGAGIFMALPLLGQKWENKLLEARKAEARRRPIEQIQNSIMARERFLESYRAAVERIGARIKSRADAVRERINTKEGYDPTRHLQALETAKGAHKQMVDKYNSGVQALTMMRDKLDDAQFDWEFSEDFMATKNDIKAASGQDLLDGILVDESFKAVRDQYNSVFASLEMDVQQINSTKQLSYDDGALVIDLSDINVPEMVKR